MPFLGSIPIRCVVLLGTTGAGMPLPAPRCVRARRNDRRCIGIPEALDLPTMGSPILERMIGRATLRATLLVASFLLAALVFAPAQALAHAGHDHSVAVDPSPQAKPPVPVAVPAVPTAAPSRDVVTPAHDNEPATSIVAFYNSTLQFAPDLPAPTKGCPGGCCQTAGPSCCPIVLLSAMPTVAPPPGHSVFPELVHRGVGVKPGALPEPPKSLI
jgi:hypothetical protein